MWHKWASVAAQNSKHSPPGAGFPLAAGRRDRRLRRRALPAGVESRNQRSLAGASRWWPAWCVASVTRSRS
jgi:hypothetical protein